MIHVVVFLAAAVGVALAIKVVADEAGSIAAFIHKATAPRVPPTPPEIGTTWVSAGANPWAVGVTVKDVKDGWVAYRRNWDHHNDFCVLELKEFVRQFPVQKTT